MLQEAVDARSRTDSEWVRGAVKRSQRTDAQLLENVIMTTLLIEQIVATNCGPTLARLGLDNSTRNAQDPYTGCGVGDAAGSIVHAGCNPEEAAVRVAVQVLQLWDRMYDLYVTACAVCCIRCAAMWGFDRAAAGGCLRCALGHQVQSCRSVHCIAPKPSV